MNRDVEHLRLLSIFHYVVAGIGALFACFPVFHLVLGLVMLFAPQILEHGPRGNPEALRLVGSFFVVIAAAVMLTGWTISFCVCLAGRYLGRRQHYTFCLVMAGILCLFAPFGTVLGVFTIIVLVRPSVRALFEQEAGAWCGNPTPPR
jgi:hypothetical protein